jgi:FkbM family methyltransferase
LTDWRFLATKYLTRRKYGYGFAWVWTTSLEAAGSEDFNEPAILDKGKDLIDGGAAYGFWSIRASRYYDRIVAVEPDGKTFKILRRNVRANGIKNIVCLKSALGAENGRMMFYENGNAESSILASHMGKDATGPRVWVDMVTVDKVVQTEKLSPSVIKLDVEGAELKALEGARSTIDEFMPILLVEVHHPVLPEQVERSLPEYEWKTRWRYLNTQQYPFDKQPHLEGRPKALKP